MTINKIPSKSMKAKAISAIVSLCMLFSLTACGKSGSSGQSQNHGAGMATNHNQEITEIPGPSVDDPHHTISTGVDIEVSSQPAQPAGQYEYTIYDGVVINMDINVDDYIITNNAGQKVFKIYDLAHDKLGWEGNEPGDIAYRSNRYNLGGNQVYLVPYTDTQQLRHIDFNYSGCELGYRIDKCEFMLSGTCYMASYDDIVFLSYVLWSGATNPESHPFEVFSGHYTLGYDNNGIDVKLP